MKNDYKYCTWWTKDKKKLKIMNMVEMGTPKNNETDKWIFGKQLRIKKMINKWCKKTRNNQKMTSELCKLLTNNETC